MYNRMEKSVYQNVEKQTVDNWHTYAQIIQSYTQLMHRGQITGCSGPNRSIISISCVSLEFSEKLSRKQLLQQPF